MGQQPIKRRAGRPSAEETEMKRNGLIVVALEEFARAGFYAASLRDIAEKAQISSRTLYNYYPDKTALFEACLDYSGRKIQPSLPEVDGDLDMQLITYTIAMQQQLFTPLSRQIAMLIYREGSEFDRLRQIAHLQFERYQVAPVAGILALHGIAAERAHLLAKQFVAMAFGEWQRRLLFGGEVMSDGEIDTHARLVTGLFLHGASAALPA